MATQAAVRTIRERAIFRRWERFRLNLPIRLIVRRDSTTKVIESRANDISEGGMLVFSGVELKTDDEVSVEFTAPYAGEPVRSRCIVRHRRGYRYGLEFMCHTPAEKQDTEKLRMLLRMSAGSIK